MASSPDSLGLPALTTDPDVAPVAPGGGVAPPSSPREENRSCSSTQVGTSSQSSFFDVPWQSGLQAKLAKVDTEGAPNDFSEGMLQGAARLGVRLQAATGKLQRKSAEGLQQGGAFGLLSGSVEGVIYSSCEVHRGVCEFASSSIEGTRAHADVVADCFLGKERPRHKHGSELECEGRLLHSYIRPGEEPEHFLQGIAVGGTCLGKSFADGLKTFLEMPAELGQEEGALGYCRGVGQATKALSLKVAAGGLDLAASVVTGAKNTPQTVDKIRKKFMQKGEEDGEWGPYDPNQAPASHMVGKPVGTCPDQLETESVTCAQPAGATPKAAWL